LINGFESGESWSGEREEVEKEAEAEEEEEDEGKERDAVRVAQRPSRRK
jgi:hypothetical protein